MPRPYTRTPCGIYGPRNLVRRHAKRVKSRAESRLRALTSEPPKLKNGEEQLFSFYKPSLEAGEYTLTIGQEINSEETSENLSLPEGGTPLSTQTFEVVAPRFSLPDGAIHSSFPPQGYGALANTLPHVVLTDPHLPWARIASTKDIPSNPRNIVPWLALLVFTQDELKLSADQLSKDGLFTNAVKQTQTFTIKVAVADVHNIKSTISPITGLVLDPSDDKETDVIMVPSALFSELVKNYDKNGDLVDSGPDLTRYQYMSHVRDIDTTGMADAGVEDNGVFGIVVSHRTGPLSNTQPQPVVAHLVSIEGIELPFMKENWPIDPNTTPYVAMTSLHSWNFVTLPENSFNIETTLVNLGTTVDNLRAPKSVIKGIDTSTAVGSRLKNRLQDGYTLTKYRTITGEITAAINRGPFTPTIVPYPLLCNQPVGTAWLSNSGIDLQIMDQEMGVMDITYSVAWQLGKTLAVADQVFTASLGKLRTAIFNGAMNAAKKEILASKNAYQSRDDTVRSLLTTIPQLNKLHKETTGLHAPGGSLADRWNRPQAEDLDVSYRSPLVQEIFEKCAAEVGSQLMRSSDGDGTELYDELNTPSSIDWMIVLNWVLNKMYLYSIPAHYLIVDPTYLSPESLRFFHVDRNWLDALIDGALSLGNHFDGVDQMRQTIHSMIETYLTDPSITTPRQIPTYGFLMHSAAVTQYPDLKVTINLAGLTEQTPILRHENLDVPNGVMLCLLDQVPGNPGLDSVTFTQPPHQQSFIAGAELDSHHFKTLYKQIFTLAGQEPNPKPWDSHHWMRPNDPAPSTGPPPLPDQDDEGVPHAKAVFNWGTKAAPEIRTLLPTAWAEDVNGVLNFCGKKSQPPQYEDDVPNAAMAGIQLNNPIYRLVIQNPPSPPSPTEGQGSSNDTAIPFPAVEKSTTTRLPVHGAPPGEEKTSLPENPIDGEAKPNEKSPRVGDDFELGPSHGHPLVPAPHSRPLRARNGPMFGEPSPDLGIGPAGAPQYEIACFPTDNSVDRPGIPCGTGIPKDLVFIIQQVKQDAPFGDYKLNSFTIVLQLGDKTRMDRCLLSDYQGPGPFMISNLRFIVQCQPDDDPKFGRCIALRIIPRSTKKYATPNWCGEMSFVLPVCMILPHDIDIEIPIFITPEYVDSDPITTENLHVLKFQH